MRYYVLSAIGAAVLFASLTAFAYSLLELIQVGTCASGGPYVSQRPCPDGTGTYIVILTASVFTALMGIGLYVAKGRPPGAEAAPAASRLGISSALGLAGNLSSRVRAGRAAEPATSAPPQRSATPPSGAPSPGAGSAGDDRLERLERLGKLRDEGVITPSEFEAEKAKILAGL